MTKPEDEYVFLSYNSQDKDAVERIAARLRAAGVEPWRDREQLLLGRPLDPAIAEALQRSRAVVVVLGPRGLRERITRSMGVGATTKGGVLGGGLGGLGRAARPQAGEREHER